MHPVTLVWGVGLTDSVSLLLMLCLPWVGPLSVTTPCVSTIDGIPWAAFYFFKKLINFFWERESACARVRGGGVQREKGRENLRETLCWVQSPKGREPMTMWWWPELKPTVGRSVSWAAQVPLLCFLFPGISHSLLETVSHSPPPFCPSPHPCLLGHHFCSLHPGPQSLRMQCLILWIYHHLLSYS